jgi:hypothetical protein
MRSRSRICLVVLLMLSAAVVHAGEARVELVHTEPPTNKGASGAAFRDGAYRITLPDNTIVSVWPLRGCPPGVLSSHRSPPPRDRVNFDVLAPGALLGLVRLSGAGTDSRGQRVDPGTCVLRYAIQPIFKEHLGVSRFRDFALLIPADQDGLSPSESQDESIARSRAASGGGHPIVVSVLPIEDRTAVGQAFSRGRLVLEAGGSGERVLALDVCGLSLGLAVPGERPPGE